MKIIRNVLPVLSLFSFVGSFGMKATKEEYVVSVASPSGKFIACVPKNNKKQIKIIDKINGKLYWQFECAEEVYVYSLLGGGVIWSPNNKYLITIEGRLAENAKIEIWDISKKKRCYYEKRCINNVIFERQFKRYVVLESICKNPYFRRCGKDVCIFDLENKKYIKIYENCLSTKQLFFDSFGKFILFTQRDIPKELYSEMLSNSENKKYKSMVDKGFCRIVFNLQKGAEEFVVRDKFKERKSDLKYSSRRSYSLRVGKKKAKDNLNNIQKNKKYSDVIVKCKLISKKDS